MYTGCLQIWSVRKNSYWIRIVVGLEFHIYWIENDILSELMDHQLYPLHLNLHIFLF